ncbi:MAG: cupin domain-containing protein [Nitriliruptorales bacterium]|nr:cupin domain-containing protein [Nitriliruptorales bacterium]
MPEDTPIEDPLSDRWVGVVFTNPVSGERIEVLEVDSHAEESRLKGRLTVAPGGIGPPRHVHPHQQEQFTVEEGRLTVHRDDDTRELTAGESLTVPPGHAHGFENRSEQPVVFTGVIHPGGKLLHALSTLFGLAREGKTRDDGTPHFLQAMVFAQAMRHSMYLAAPPRPIQEALWTVFAPIGRMLGYQATYDRYLRPAFWEPQPDHPS